MDDGRQPGWEPGQEPDEPVFDEPIFSEPTLDEPAFQEPVFHEPALPEISPEAPLESSPDEPVFLDAPAEPGPSASPDSPEEDEYAPFGQETSLATPRGRRRRLGQTGPIWLILAGVILVVLVAFLLDRRGGDAPAAPPAPPEPAVTAPQEAAAPVAEPAQPSPTPEPPTPTPIPLLQPGQRVVVGNTDGDGIRLRNAPGLNSLTLEIYLDGRAFLVLEPGSEFTSYPVEVDGYRWYRVQVADDPADQLVGWVAGDFLLPAP